MNDFNNKALTKNSQILRKSMTKEERKLWYKFLKNLPVTVHRQKIIGNYIVDFYCAAAKLVIELDGSQHYEDEAQQKDRERDDALSAMGLTVVRYTNLQIDREFETVCRDIYIRLTACGAVPSP